MDRQGAGGDKNNNQQEQKNQVWRGHAWTHLDVDGLQMMQMQMCEMSGLKW